MDDTAGGHPREKALGISLGLERDARESGRVTRVRIGKPHHLEDDVPQGHGSGGEDAIVLILPRFGQPQVLLQEVQEYLHRSRLGEEVFDARDRATVRPILG